MEPAQLVLMILLALGAGAVQGMTGFGFAVLLMGFFPLLIGVKTANVLVSLVGTVIAIFVFVPLRKSVAWRRLAPVLVGTAVGIPLGILVLVRADERLITVSLGVFVIAYLLFELLVRERLKARMPGWVGYAAGLLGGAFGGAFTSGGPPVVAYLSSLDLDKDTVKATILGAIILTSFYKIALLLLTGLITESVLRYAAVLIGPAFAGATGGAVLFRRVSSRAFQRIVQGLLLVVAVLLIVRG